VFAVLLYNIRRLTGFLLKSGVDGEIDYALVLTPGEYVELVSSTLLPSDRATDSLPDSPLRGGNALQ